jgi:hypothetical protein
MMETETVMPLTGPDADGLESHRPSFRSHLLGIRGGGHVRRKSGGSLIKYDAGLMKSTLDGKVLGLGFSHQLSPAISFSGQTGLGFTSISPQAVLGFGIKIKF